LQLRLPFSPPLTVAACFALGCPAGSLSQPSALAITLAACRVGGGTPSNLREPHLLAPGVALRLAPCGRALTLCFPHVVAALGEAAAGVVGSTQRSNVLSVQAARRGARDGGVRVGHPEQVLHAQPQVGAVADVWLRAAAEFSP
jgi:hypothetical protein